MLKENSRYYNLPRRIYVSASGEQASYISRRFIPRREDIAIAGHHVVQLNDRLDRIASNAYGQGTEFWRIADYQLTLDAHSLAERTGERLEVPLVGPSSRQEGKIS